MASNRQLRPRPEVRETIPPCIIYIPFIRDARYPCEMCHGVKHYADHNGLKDHLGQKHGGVRMIFCCRRCQQFFPTVKGTKLHQKSCNVPPVQAPELAEWNALGLAFVRELEEIERNIAGAISPARPRGESPPSGHIRHLLPDVADDADEAPPPLLLFSPPPPLPLLITSPPDRRTSFGTPILNGSSISSQLWSFRGETNT